MQEPFASWSEFNVAVAGAGAALGGLLIVALSVNIATIARSRGLAARAGASIAALILGVALSCAALIPGQAPVGFGVQVLIGTALCAAIDVRSGLTVARDAASAGFGRYTVERVSLFAVPTLVYAVAGILLVALPGSVIGLVLVAAATILAIIGTVAFSWVALVEVLR